jgi:putative endonuclease
MDRRRETGAAGERAAAEFLRGLKYAIVERNYRCRGGEIDLVALHRGAVVFVEVRTRSAGALVAPIESVDDAKRRRIVTAARHYTARHRLHDHPMRFDLVAVHAAARGMTCELVTNAFDLDDLGPPRRRW